MSKRAKVTTEEEVVVEPSEESEALDERQKVILPIPTYCYHTACGDLYHKFHLMLTPRELLNLDKIYLKEKCLLIFESIITEDDKGERQHMVFFEYE